jgi:putative Ca2+/H+ antiporter (TMEM165/GDT1 family)
VICGNSNTYAWVGFAVSLALLLVPVLAVADTLLAVAAFPFPRPFLTSPLPLLFLAFGFGAETEGLAETTSAESMRAKATRAEPTLTRARVANDARG